MNQVVGWYIAQQAEIRRLYGPDVANLAFVHIPPKALSDLQKKRGQPGGADIYPGINGELIGHQAEGCVGVGASETCTYNTKDTPFLNALAATNNFLGLFTGHNHKVDWCGRWWHEVNMCSGRRTGYGGYGKEFAKGARKIVVHEARLAKKELETWVRLEDGRISGQVSLNATFGQDYYPAVGSKKGGAS